MFNSDELLMKMTIFADSHGNTAGVRDAVAASGEIDGIVHLGDGVSDGQQVAAENRLGFCGVYGNEDYGSKLAECSMLRPDNWPILLIHGHQWDMNPYYSKDVMNEQIDSLAKFGVETGAACLFFGHTHQWHLEKRRGIILCNPGNQYIGSPEYHSFAMLKSTPGSLTVSIVEKTPDNKLKDKQVIRISERNLSGIKKVINETG